MLGAKEVLEGLLDRKAHPETTELTRMHIEWALRHYPSVGDINWIARHCPDTFAPVEIQGKTKT